jgi:ferredoxin
MTGGARRRIVVDRDRCIGSGNCSFYAPSTFDLDDEMKSVVIDPGGGTTPATCARRSRAAP